MERLPLAHENSICLSTLHLRLKCRSGFTSHDKVIARNADGSSEFAITFKRIEQHDGNAESSGLTMQKCPQL